MPLLSAASIDSLRGGNTGPGEFMGHEQDYHQVLPVQVEPGELPDWVAPHVAVNLAGQPDAAAAAAQMLEVLARVFKAGGPPPAAGDDHAVGIYPGLGPAISNLPSRNRVFTDRLEVLKDMRGALLAEPAAGGLQTCALHGLGGIGKTQTVIEFAYLFGSHYD